MWPSPNIVLEIWPTKIINKKNLYKTFVSSNEEHNVGAYSLNRIGWAMAAERQTYLSHIFGECVVKTHVEPIYGAFLVAKTKTIQIFIPLPNS